MPYLLIFDGVFFIHFPTLHCPTPRRTAHALPCAGGSPGRTTTALPRTRQHTFSRLLAHAPCTGYPPIARAAPAILPLSTCLIYGFEGALRSLPPALCSAILLRAAHASLAGGARCRRLLYRCAAGHGRHGGDSRTNISCQISRLDNQRRLTATLPTTGAAARGGVLASCAAALAHVVVNLLSFKARARRSGGVEACYAPAGRLPAWELRAVARHWRRRPSAPGERARMVGRQAAWAGSLSRTYCSPLQPCRPYILSKPQNRRYGQHSM